MKRKIFMVVAVIASFIWTAASRAQRSKGLISAPAEVLFTLPASASNFTRLISGTCLMGTMILRALPPYQAK